MFTTKGTQTQTTHVFVPQHNTRADGNIFSFWEFVLNISNLRNTLVTLCHLPYGYSATKHELFELDYDDNDDDDEKISTIISS